MLNVNYEYYKIFYYVAKYSNFTRAARVLGSSQPNVTRAMNSLEQQMDCRLFIRTNRGVQLTPAGEHLYTRVSAAMIQLQAAEQELSADAGLEHGSISIGVSATALNIFLLEHLKSFHMAYPGIRLKIYNHSTPQAVRAVQSGEIDFAVVTTPVEVSAPLKSVPLMPFQEILIGGRTFADLEKQELSLADLSSYPMICLGPESVTGQFYRRLFQEYGLELQPDTELATTDQILPMVRAELGLAFVPEPMARESIRRDEIIKIALRESIPERMVCMIYDRQRQISPAARRMKSALTDPQG